MKDILTFINEANKTADEWYAVGVTTKGDDYSDKTSYSERIVTKDTYDSLRRGEGSKRSYRTIVGVELLGKSRDKEIARSYLSKSEKKRRTTPIDKGTADYLVYCISSGPINKAGKTMWDWSIFDEEYSKDFEIYFGECYGGASFLFGTKGSFKKGDTLYCVDNDSLKKLSGTPRKVDFVCDCTYDAFVKEFRKHYPERCKAPSFQFGKHSDGIPWSGRFLGQMYSIKGIE